MIEIDKRIKKMALVIGGFSKKILKKEFKKMQKDLIKGVFKNANS